MKRPLPVRAILIVLGLLALCWLPVIFELYSLMVAGFLTISMLTSGWIAQEILGGKGIKRKD